MSDAFARLRKVALFDGLSDDDLERICTDVQDIHLGPGHTLFEEGDRGDRAYVITDGEIEILKASERREVLLAVRGPGEVIGEMALLQEEPRIAGARARTTAELVAIPKAALDELLDTSPTAARSMFGTFLDRLRATNDQLKQNERMAQLGTLTAGVAHELNNPAAAVARAARRLDEEMRDFVAQVAPAVGGDLRAAAMGLVDNDRAAPADALARSDAESELEDWLEQHGVPEPWDLSAGLVDAGIRVTDLASLDASDPRKLADALRMLVASASLHGITTQIIEGTTRLSSIVRSLKSYAYLDQSPVQDVDVRQGLEDTLVLLAHRTRHVRVVREFDEDVPTITALGTELNQVWTNLIDNACDALEETADRIPTLTLRVGQLPDDNGVVVEIEDNGPGIAPEHVDQVFDAFFTTKPPGRGTGLGLQISYRIVVLEHRGDLAVQSEPGRTTFRVTLPLEQPEPPDPETREDDMSTDTCEHLEAVDDPPRPDPADGCPDCRAAGDSWVHLRYCATCGKAGCCDDSPNRHAREHATTGDHPVIGSLEAGETWLWCFVHRQGVDT